MSFLKAGNIVFSKGFLYVKVSGDSIPTPPDGYRYRKLGELKLMKLGDIAIMKMKDLMFIAE